MKLKPSPFLRSNSRFPTFLAVSLGFVVAGSIVLSPYAMAANQTWDGGAGTSSLNDANNWTNNALPSGSGDTGTWDATVPGDLSLTWSSAGFGSTTNGFNVNLAAGHTGTLTLDAAATSGNFSLGTIAIASGAGAFTLGNGSGTANVVIRGTNTFTNNDNDTATINADVFFASGGGTARTVTFAGTGNWDVYDGFALSGSGSIKLAKLGAGTLTLNAAGSYSGGTDIGTTTLGSSAVVRAAATQALGSGSVAILGNDGNNRLELFSATGISLNNGITVSGRATAGQAAILNVSGNNTLSGLLTLTTGGNQYAIESAAGTLALTNAGTTTFADASRVLTLQGAGNGSYAGVLAGAGGLTKAGAGIWTLSGANTFTGATNVNDGTLAFSTTPQNLGSSAFTVAGGGGLSVKAAAAGSTLLTTNSLTMGAGTTSLTFDFNGLNPSATQISTGALALNGTVNLGFLGTAGLTTNTYSLIDYTGSALSDLSNFSNTTFSFGHSSGTLVNNTDNTSLDLSVLADSVTWSGAGTQTWTTAATGDSTGPNEWTTKSGQMATNFWVNDAVEFNDTYNIGAGDVAVANRTVTITGSDVSPSVVTFNNSAGDYTLSGSFGIAGATSLTKDGTSALTINNGNTYSGGTTLNAGTLALGASERLADSGAVTVNGGTFDLGSNTETVGAVTLTGGSIANGTLTGSSYAVEAGSVPANLTGGGALTKSTAGTVTLSGANTYTGATTINAGTLALTGTHVGGGSITVNSGAEFTGDSSGTNSLGNFLIASGSATLSSGTYTVTATSGNTALSGTGSLTVNGATLNVNNGNDNVWFAIGSTADQTATMNLSSGAINASTRWGTQVGQIGNGVLNITGGTFTATDTAGNGLKIAEGAATTGAIHLDGGILRVNRIGSSNGTGKFYFNGGTFSPTASSTTWFANNANLSTEVRNGGAIIDTAGFDVTIGEQLTHSTFEGTTATDGGLTKNGAGTLRLDAANTFTGNVTLNAGAIEVGSASVFVGQSTALGSGTLVVNGGTLTARNGSKSLDNAVTVNESFTLNGTAGGENLLTLAGDVNLAGGTRTLTVDATGGALLSGVVSNGGLTKAGTGIMTLTGANTYTGATTISEGTLALGSGGSIDNTSGVSLGSGGTFDVSATGGYTVNNLTGSGTIVGALTVSTELAIGNSPGTTDFESLTLGSSSVYTYEMIGGGIEADLGNVSGTLTIDPGASLDLVQLGTYTMGQKFTLFGYATGNLIGTFDGLVDGSIFNDAGGDWLISYNDTTAGLNGGDGTSFVTITAIPEPSAALLGGLGMLALLRRRKN